MSMRWIWGCTIGETRTGMRDRSFVYVDLIVVNNLVSLAHTCWQNVSMKMIYHFLIHQIDEILFDYIILIPIRDLYMIRRHQ